jgi:hypothetical protein
MTITTEQIYDVQKSGKSIFEIFMQALARGDDVVIELPFRVKLQSKLNV